MTVAGTFMRYSRCGELAPRGVRRVLEARVDRLQAALARLADAQAQTETRLCQLAEAQRRADDRMEELAEALRQLTVRVDGLTGRMDRLTDVVGDLKGRVLEQAYRDRAAAYFDDVLRKIHALSAEEVATLLDDAQSRGAIAEADRRELRRVDVVVRGRQQESDVSAYLAVEVSSVLDENDVWRALRRAEVLGRATGAPAMPVVAGEQITPEAEELGRSRGVWRVLDGLTFAPQE
ncbi:MAG: hypothetical protein ACRDJN_00450 [Chloroflexota bacterium]